jgi:energy-coupling factor transport system permease protein
MSQFELLRNVTVGQYIPADSVVHRLDPRAKLAIALGLILAASFSRALLPMLGLLLGIVVITKMAHLSLRYVLRGLVLGLPLLALVFLTQLLFQGWTEPAGRVFVAWGWLRITHFSLHLISVGLLRIICFIFATSLLTMTTTTTALTHGVERLLQPLRRLGVPAHELALVNMIALRFVPTLAEEMEQVMKAQASRCADIDAAQKIWRPDQAAQLYLPLLVPLFINALRRGEELTQAMAARCYLGGDGRTKFVTLQSSPRDYAALAIFGVLVLVLALTPWPSLGEVLAMIGVKPIF